MRKADKRTLGVLAAVAVAAILAGLIAYYEKPGERQEPLLTGEAKATRAAMARIEAESGGTVRPPEIQAAPRTAEAPAAVDKPAQDTVPSPPDGYSFVSYHGEMRRARIPAGAEAGDEQSSPGPDWLNTAASIETIVDQASAAGRDWSFGWVRAARDAGPNDVAASPGEFGATALGLSLIHI